MDFIVSIGCDNAAFKPDAGPEVARLLRDLAERISNGEREGYFHDENGNKVGVWEFSI